MNLSHWLGDLLADLEQGHEANLDELALVAQELLDKAQEHADYYAQDAPLEGEPVRAQMAEMAELLAQVAESLGAYVDTQDLEHLRAAQRQAQELCDIRDGLHYELQGESDRDSQMASY